jgi:hypothetical protein
MTSRDTATASCDFKLVALHLRARLTDFDAEPFDLAADLGVRRQTPGWLFGHCALLARTDGSTTGLSVTDRLGLVLLSMMLQALSRALRESVSNSTV